MWLFYETEVMEHDCAYTGIGCCYTKSILKELGLEHINNINVHDTTTTNTHYYYYYYY